MARRTSNEGEDEDFGTSGCHRPRRRLGDGGRNDARGRRGADRSGRVVGAVRERRPRRAIPARRDHRHHAGRATAAGRRRGKGRRQGGRWASVSDDDR